MISGAPYLTMTLLSTLCSLRNQASLQAPTQYEAAVDVDYRGQIYESLLRRNICDANAPNLVPVVNFKPSQQIWLNILCHAKVLSERLLYTVWMPNKRIQHWISCPCRRCTQGLKCSCFCPHCGAKLYAKNGDTIREHHFAHEHGAECAGA